MNDTLKTWLLTLKSQLFSFALLCAAGALLWYQVPHLEGVMLKNFTQWQHRHESKLTAQTVIVAIDEPVVDILQDRFKTQSINDKFYHALIKDLNRLDVTNIVVSAPLQTQYVENNQDLKEKKLYLTQRYGIDSALKNEKFTSPEEVGVYKPDASDITQRGVEPYLLPLFYTPSKAVSLASRRFPSLSLSGALQYFNSQNEFSKASWLSTPHQNFMHTGQRLTIIPDQFKVNTPRRILTGEAGEIMLRWTSKKAFYYRDGYSTRQLLKLSDVYQPNNLDALSALKGHPIVLADLTETGVRTQPSVLHERHLEADVIATGMDNLIQQKSMHTVSSWQVLVILVLMSLVCFVPRALKKNPVWGIIAFGISTLAYVGFSYLMPIVAGVVYPFAAPLIVAIMAYVCGEFYWKILDEKDLRNLELNMTQLVSKSVLKEIQTKKTRLEAGGKRINITSMFIDIRNFTTLSENLPPMEVTEILNAWYTEVEVITNEYRGTVDKFLGDGALVMFGAPVETSQHADMALKAARHLIESSKAMGKRWKQERQIDFSVGISVNSGFAFVGFIGPQNKLEYTAIGDTVNTSARLQDQLKTYHTQIIFSESTLKQCLNINLGGEISGLGEVKVRGKEQYTSLYTFNDMFQNGFTAETAIAYAAKYAVVDIEHSPMDMPAWPSVPPAQLTVAQVQPTAQVPQALPLPPPPLVNPLDAVAPPLIPPPPAPVAHAHPVAPERRAPLPKEGPAQATLTEKQRPPAEVPHPVSPHLQQAPMGIVAPSPFKRLGTLPPPPAAFKRLSPPPQAKPPPKPPDTPTP